MVMREIEETSYNYNCLRQKKKEKKGAEKKDLQKKEKKRGLRWYEIGI